MAVRLVCGFRVSHSFACQSPSSLQAIVRLRVAVQCCSLGLSRAVDRGRLRLHSRVFSWPGITFVYRVVSYRIASKVIDTAAYQEIEEV